ncbi:DUF3108 domain-containing protein [Marilutibacter spongiae]|uniref:DUF3108 domain-containing protein n=1 Tax=Marilutibacter spongiae TaxID=2025720 RepID=A0A7W3TLG9_9GAMM|nr:DUF3108 domain-containing protein [Lysobacter spongiae]MBB1060249.1 DUF3108 domain-containing protein [Lysobacter spongiae]
MNVASKIRNTLSKAPVLVLGTALALAVLPARAIEPFTADYKASYMGMEANGQMTLAREGEGRWRYSLNVRNALADLSQITVFEVSGDQWRPLSSNDTNKVLVKRSQKTATYDWAAGEARWSGDVKPDRAGPIALKAGDLDALLINLALVRDVAAGKPLKYRMVDDGRIKQLDYRNAGTETITVDGRRHQATKVVGNDGRRETTAWIVEGMQVPARIVQKDKDGDALELTMQAIR